MGDRKPAYSALGGRRRRSALIDLVEHRSEGYSICKLYILYAPHSESIMNIRQLEIFLAVSDCGSFTSAAERLFMAQPAVSLAVQKLETSLDTTLFRRERTGVSLTEEGRVIARHGKAILAHVDNARQEIGAFQRLEIGRISLGAPAMVTGYVLAAAIAEFKRTYPGIELNVVQAGAKEIEDHVRAGRLDIGVISDWRTSTGLHVERVATHRIVAIVSTSSKLSRRRKLSWRELLQQPLVLFPRTYYQRQLVDHKARELGRVLEVTVETESLSLIAELIAHDIGVATLLDAAADSYADGIAQVALPSDAQVPVALCRANVGQMNRAGQALWAFLKTHGWTQPSS